MPPAYCDLIFRVPSRPEGETNKRDTLTGNVIKLGVIAKPVRRLVVAISFCLGDSHASVSTGSE